MSDLSLGEGFPHFLHATFFSDPLPILLSIFVFLMLEILYTEYKSRALDLRLLSLLFVIAQQHWL